MWDAIAMFQSHLGSILPSLPDGVKPAVEDSFNPTLVRFCRVPPQHQAAASALVSIPPWFDFARFADARGSPDEHVSIPPWFDFAGSEYSEARCNKSVSIPPWFDFACRFRRGHGKAFSVSIPPWFDFAAGTSVSLVPAGSFQSHLGSILPMLVFYTAKHSLLFQSHLGSILPPYVAHPRRLIPPVSIPPWFDFALHPPPPADQRSLRFNPTLVRFCRRENGHRNC